MKVIEQYPHDLWKDDGSGGWIFVSKCREETAGWDPETIAGVFARNNSVVFMPLGTETIPRETTVKVTDQFGFRVQGDVYKYDRGQLSHRLWI